MKRTFARAAQAGVLAMLCVACTILLEASSGPLSQSAELVASDGISHDNFGASVAMNETSLVVGAPGQIGIGAAYVFTGSGTNWTQVAKLTPSDGKTGAQFGYAVALSGNTVAVGAPMDSAVYVFVKPATGWQNMTETAKLTYAGGDLGYCVTFAGGGKFLLAGAFFLNAAYVFEKPTGSWANTATPSANLVAPSGSTAFGTALAASGTTVVVGAHTTNNVSGTAYVYKLQSGVTNLEASATLTPSDSGGFMGEAVAINGNTVVAGAQGHDNGTGAAYIFIEPTGGWASETQTAELGPGGQLGTAFGASVAVYKNMIFVGRPSGKVGAVDEFIEPGWRLDQQRHS